MAPQYTALSRLVKVYDSIIAGLFPSECLSCGQEGPWLCSACEQKCLQIQMPTCPFCDKLSPLGKTCTRCRKKYALTGCRSVWYYREAIPPLIRHYKYKKVHAAREQLRENLRSILEELPLARYRTTIITSVPTSSSRLKDRGYNQSELLAQMVAQDSGLPYVQLLSRTNDTPSQTKLSRQNRFANMKDQFKPKVAVPNNAVVVIIDDVFTTGATLANCAETLKQAGAKSVWGITVAKD